MPCDVHADTGANSTGCGQTDTAPLHMTAQLFASQSPPVAALPRQQVPRVLSLGSSPPLESGLGARAVRLGIALFVQHIPGANNPADSYTRTSGFLKWNESIKKVESLIQASPKPSVDSTLEPRVDSEKPYSPGTSRSAWG